MMFMRMSKRGSFVTKFLSLLVAMAFVFTSLGFAAPEDGQANPAKPVTVVTDPAHVNIPKEFGMVKAKFTGNSGKLVINIQDAHCNYEAQTNIANIVETLIKNDGLKCVSVEGADGIIDTSWFKAFPDAEVRKEVATYFMKKGEITGPEFLSITTDYPITLFGAETREYYVQNLNAFTSSYSLKEATETYYNQIKSALNKLKGYIYSDDLKLMDAKMADYESKKLAFNEYISYLGSMAEKLRINIREYDNLFKLISTLAYEKKIDFKVVDKERSTLIDELSKKLAKDKLTELVTQSLAFKTAKISAAEYYEYLKDLSTKNGIDIAARFKNLATYIVYNAVYSKIENEKLFADIKKIETAIKEKLFTSDDQRTLEKLSRHVDTLLGLVNIKLLNEDFDYYKSHRDEFAHEVFVDFLSKEGTKYGLSYEVEPPSDAVKESMAKLEDFYVIAIKRNEALIDNTLAEMDREETKIAVLVTGGFHTEGMCKLLEDRGISYMVICPTITKDVQTPYIQILMNQRTSFEDILVGAVDTTQTTQGQTQQQGMLAPVVISWAISLGEGVLQGIDKDLGFPKQEGLEARLENDMRECARTYGNIISRNLLERLSGTKVNLEDIEAAMSVQLGARIDAYKNLGPWKTTIIFEVISALKRESVARAERQTPGVQPGGRRALTGEQAMALDAILKESFDMGEAAPITKEDLKRMKLEGLDLGRGLMFVAHDWLVESIDGYNKSRPAGEKRKLGYVVHPGRGPEHKLLQAHIDKYIFERLSKENPAGLMILARHEIAHLDIFNVEERIKKGLAAAAIKQELGEEAYATWEKWVAAGKPVGDEQEEFVNGIGKYAENGLKYDVTVLAVRMAEIAVEKRKLTQRKLDALPLLKRNLQNLRKAVNDSKGAPQIVGIVNPGDNQVVDTTLNGSKAQIIRKDGLVVVLVHPEAVRRGQLLGLLDAMRSMTFDTDTVILGIMMPGQGTRFSPFTQSLNGIKPFMPMLIRVNKDSQRWLTGAEASLYTWNLIAHHLNRMGFRGIAWKWGDEPQVASVDLSKINIDLSKTDFVRFGSETVVTDDLAENKEWLNAGENGTLIAQVRRRGRTDLLKSLGVADAPGAKAMVHLGSPAFSYLFIEEAQKIFGSWKGWMDVDGYLCEALTQDEAKWQAEYDREMQIGVRKILEGYYRKGDIIDPVVVWQKMVGKTKDKDGRDIDRTPEPRDIEEMNGVLARLAADEKVVKLVEGRYMAECGKCAATMMDRERDALKFKEPGIHELERLVRENNPELAKQGITFYAACRQLKANIENRRGGAPLEIKVINFGEDLYWGDIGQLSKAREALHAVAEKTPEGDFARSLAAIDEIKPDEHGNIIVGECIYPKDGSVRNSVLINTKIYGTARVRNAVLVNSTLGDVHIAGGSVVYGSTVMYLVMGRNAFSFRSVSNDLKLSAYGVHTTMPKDPKNTAIGLDDWRADQRQDVGSPENYKNAKFGNPRSFEEQQKIMRQRDVLPDVMDAQIEKLFAAPLKARIQTMADRKKFKTLKFGTSGLRDYDDKLIDMEVYINTRGFIEYLISLGEQGKKGGIKRGDAVKLAGDFRPTTPQIMRAAAAAIIDSDCKVGFIGNKPTPELMLRGMQDKQASVMVTGSHIPWGMNGIKFNRPDGEILKDEESPILSHVAMIRKQVHEQSLAESIFAEDGMFKPTRDMNADQTQTIAAAETAMGQQDTEAIRAYVDRYVKAFGKIFDKEDEIVFFQHTAVGREVLPAVFEALGATVIRVDPMNEKETFYAVDTEKMKPEVRQKLASLAVIEQTDDEGNAIGTPHKPFAVTSADGDSDRPVLCDEDGNFIPGDKLGVLASIVLKPDYVAIPITCNSDAHRILRESGVAESEAARVGSPFINKKMLVYLGRNKNAKVAGFEANGGYLTGSTFAIRDKDGNVKGELPALPTRDSALPMIATMYLAKQKGVPISELLNMFKRHTNADAVEGTTEVVINGQKQIKQGTPGCEMYTPAIGENIIKNFTPKAVSIQNVDYQAGVVTLSDEAGTKQPLDGNANLAQQLTEIRDLIAKYFTAADGFNEVVGINYLDGVRISFKNGDVAHIRYSGNEPIMRLYGEADTQERANEIVELRLKIYPQLIRELGQPRVAVEPVRATPGVHAAVAIEGVSAEMEALLNEEEAEREAVFSKVIAKRSVYTEPEQKQKVVIIAIDNSIYTGQANPVLTELMAVAQKFGDQLGVVVVRGTGDKLFDEVDMAIKNAKAAGREVQKIVTQLSSQASDELRNKLKGIEQNIILNINVKDKDLTSHYLQVLRLFNLSLKIAYEFSGEEIKATLEKIDPKFGSMSFDEIAKMIASKILEILPAMRPIDTTEVQAAYKARQAALHSL